MPNHPDLDLSTPDHIILALSIFHYFVNETPDCRCPPGTMDHITQDMIRDWLFNRHFTLNRDELRRKTFHFAVQMLTSYTPQTFD